MGDIHWWIHRSEGLAYVYRYVFVGGTTADLSSRIYTARHMFGTLQHSTFPVYFNLSILLGGGLLGLWGFSHPAVLDHYAEPLRVDVAQAYTLGSVILVQAANQFIVGPLTSKYVWPALDESLKH